MIEPRPFNSFGNFNHGWLDTHHHFSFADYFDPLRMNWGALRVWNDDVIAPQSGFGRHSHRNMEIITYVLEGAITHLDSMGNEGRTEAGDVQVMSAGTGVEHEEWNREDVPTHLFQIWIVPAQTGGAPRWDAAKFPKADRAGALVALASGRAEDIANGALEIRQDAVLYGATLQAGQSLTPQLSPGRMGYLVCARGEVRLNGTVMPARSAAGITEQENIEITANEDSEFLFIDAPDFAL